MEYIKNYYEKQVTSPDDVQSPNVTPAKNQNLILTPSGKRPSMETPVDGS